MVKVINIENFNENFSPDYVDLSQLPAPKIIEELSFETIFQQMLTDFTNRNPNYSALTESDPVIIALQTASYRELLLRNRINEAAKSNMIAYATGSDLDNLIADLNIERLKDESDSRLRLRSQLAIESFTTAGSEKAYLFHTLSASSEIKSASVSSPNAGQVLITILSSEANGIVGDELKAEVQSYLSADDKRPLTDQVIVESATIRNYEVKAKIYLYSDTPANDMVETECRSKLEKYVASRHRIDDTLALSGIYKSLQIEGVKKVELETPSTDLTASEVEALYCNLIELEFINE